ncbi:MAG: type 4a pilus biogenesis protein PilO [Fimbriimonadales bacterium]|nr:type 4a pilus biogenesis protein PilO [Fimbriimonadales bacterium]
MAISKRIQRAQRASKLLGIAILATALLGLGSLYLPWSMTQELQARLQEKQQELATAQQAAGQLRQALAQLQATQRELQFLERGVSEAAYVPTMLKQFEQTVQQRNLQIVAIRPQLNSQQTSGNNSSDQQKKAAAKAYEEQLFEIQLRGKFWNLMSLLKTLETFPKILAVQSLSAQAKSGAELSTENPDLEIRMIVKAFIFRAAQARPASAPTGG